MAARDSTFRVGQAEARRRPDEVQAALPSEFALIDFLEYTRLALPDGNKGWWREERRLLAFVVRSGRPIVMLDLGPLDGIAEVFNGWRSSF